jgi:cell division protein FtsN
MAKPANKRQNNTNPSESRSSRGGGGSTFLGIMIGLVLGLFIALGLAWYINRLPNPFKEKAPATPPKVEVPTTKVPMTAEPKESKAPKVAEAPPPRPAADTSASSDEPPAEKAEPEKKSTSAARETFYIQTGSFQSASEADSLKARLALLGLEASIQMRELPERGVWHRVRVGPYSDVDELNRIRDVLKQNNIEAALVKVRETER